MVGIEPTSMSAPKIDFSMDVLSGSAPNVRAHRPPSPDLSKFQTPRHQSQTQTAVRCSALVRRRVLHTQKISGQSVPTRRAFRPRYGARNDNCESREIHEKKSAPVLVKNMNR